MRATVLKEILRRVKTIPGIEAAGIADMLPLGKLRVTDKEGGGSATKFTPDEQQTLITLWCIFRSPLIFGD